MRSLFPCAFIAVLVGCLIFAFHFTALALQSVYSSDSLNEVRSLWKPSHDLVQEDDAEWYLAMYQPPDQPPNNSDDAEWSLAMYQPPTNNAQSATTAPGDEPTVQQIIDAANQIAVDLQNMVSEVEQEIASEDDPALQAELRDVQSQLRSALNAANQLIDSLAQATDVVANQANNVLDGLKAIKQRATDLFRGRPTQTPGGPPRPPPGGGGGGGGAMGGPTSSGGGGGGSGGGGGGLGGAAILAGLAAGAIGFDDDEAQLPLASPFFPEPILDPEQFGATGGGESFPAGSGVITD